MTSEAEKELERIERELDATLPVGKPLAEPQTRGGGNAGTPERP